MSRPKYTLKSLNVSVLAGLLVMHSLAVNALFFRSWATIWLCAGLFVFTTWVGVGLCYHRLLTHRSFETPKWFRYVLVVVGTLSGQAGPLFWVGKHRTHHAHSDKEGDPHTPLDGFGWAHVLWLIFKKTGGKDPFVRVRDLKSDPGIVLIDQFSWVPQLLLSFLLFYLGYRQGKIAEAIAWVSWGIGMRTTLVYHVTWFVNSAAHTWGYRNFDVNDNSRNLPWSALIAGGEWHNNHHRYQNSARHGIAWYEFDPTYWVIVVLSWIGLAWDVKTPELES